MSSFSFWLQSIYIYFRLMIFTAADSRALAIRLVRLRSTAAGITRIR
jgi:hypothetical protein